MMSNTWIERMLALPNQYRDGDAWRRRKAQDWELMPRLMRAMFLVGLRFDAVERPLRVLSLLAVVVFLYLTVHNTYLAGGPELLSDNMPYFIGAMAFLAFPFLVGMLCILINGVADHWYRSTRQQLCFAKQGEG